MSIFKPAPCNGHLVTVKSKTGYSSCETCGGCEWEVVDVFLNGEQILRHAADTHLSNKKLWTEWPRALTEILGALGYTTNITLEYDYDD